MKAMISRRNDDTIDRLIYVQYDKIGLYTLMIFTLIIVFLWVV